MKNEIEILELYNEMLANTKKLSDIVRNPPKEYSFEDIKNAIADENTQHQLNALIKWVLE